MNHAEATKEMLFNDQGLNEAQHPKAESQLRRDGKLISKRPLKVTQIFTKHRGYTRKYVSRWGFKEKEGSPRVTWGWQGAGALPGGVEG